MHFRCYRVRFATENRHFVLDGARLRRLEDIVWHAQWHPAIRVPEGLLSLHLQAVHNRLEKCARSNRECLAAK